MRDNGYIYTLVTVTFLMILLSLVFFYFQVSKPSLEDTVTVIRTDELHYFVESIKKDFSRAASISGQRASTYAINYILSTGDDLEGYGYVNCTLFNYTVNGSQAAIAELMLCGTLYGSSSGTGKYMENNTIPFWVDGVREFGAGLDFIVNMSFVDFKIRPLGAYNFAVLGTFETGAKDRKNISLFFGNISTLAVVPIYLMEDPLYLVLTDEFNLIPTFKKCNSTQPIDGSDIDSWIDSECYHPGNRTSEAPSFFDRLEGRTNISQVYQDQADEMAVLLGIPEISDIGLEAMANLDEFDIYNLTIDVGKTWVDYLYFNDLEGDCEVAGMNHADFRIDLEHGLKYNPVGLNCPTPAATPSQTPQTQLTPP